MEHHVPEMAEGKGLPLPEVALCHTESSSVLPLS